MIWTTKFIILLYFLHVQNLLNSILPMEGSKGDLVVLLGLILITGIVAPSLVFENSAFAATTNSAESTTPKAQTTSTTLEDAKKALEEAMKALEEQNNTVESSTVTEESAAPAPEPVVNQLEINVDRVEDSQSGKMVYINGNGAARKAAVTITVLSESDEKIQELNIIAKRNGQFSTIWLVGSEIGDGTYTIKASDPNAQGETTFTLSGTGIIQSFDEGAVIESSSTTSTNSESEPVQSLTQESTDTGQVSIFESIVIAMYDLLSALTATMDNYQIQLNEEADTRQAADDSLQVQIDDLSAQEPAVETYDREIPIAIASGATSSLTLSCELGDLAQGGGFDVNEEEKDYIDTLVNDPDENDSWTIKVSNTHPSDPITVTLYVHCIKIVE